MANRHYSELTTQQVAEVFYNYLYKYLPVDYRIEIGKFILSKDVLKESKISISEQIELKGLD